MQVLSKVLRDLRDGCYKTETDAFHVLLYKQNTITTSSEWKELLSNAYVWYDWISQPQPAQGTSLDEVKRLQRDLVSALDSVASYVERSDTLVILSPSCVHADKINEQTHRKTYVEWTHFFFFYSPCFYTSHSLSHSPNQVHVLSNVEKTRLLRHGVLLQEFITKSYASGTSCSIGV